MTVTNTTVPKRCPKKNFTSFKLAGILVGIDSTGRASFAAHEHMQDWLRGTSCALYNFSSCRINGR